MSALGHDPLLWAEILAAFGVWAALSLLICRCIDFGMNGRPPAPPAREAGADAPPAPARADAFMDGWDMEAELAGLTWWDA